MLKDIYSPLEIDDQWDQRAPVHENTVATELPPTATQQEDPSGSSGSARPDGAVATMEPTHMDLAITPTDGMEADTSSTQPPTIEGSVPVKPEGVTETTPSAEAVIPTDPAAEVPGMQNIGEMTVPTNSDAPAADVDTTQVTGEENVFHPTDSETSAEAVSSETPTPTTMESTTDGSTSNNPASTETTDIDGSSDAGETTAPMGDAEAINTLDERDVATSDYGKPIESSVDGDASRGDDTPAEPNHEIEMATPSYEPDTDHRAKADEQDEKEAVQAIVDKPLTDNEKEEVGSDTDQIPFNPVEAEKHEIALDNKKARARETLESMIEAIDIELKKLAEKLKEYQAKQAEVEDNLDTTQTEIDAKNGEKDDFLASVTALNAPSDATNSESELPQDLDRAA